MALPFVGHSRRRSAPPGLVTEAALLTLLGVAAMFERRRARTPPEPELLADHKRGTAPLDLSWRGWRTVFVDAIKSYNRDQIGAAAAGVAYYSLLALFPAMGAVLSLFGLFADVEDARNAVLRLAGVVPPQTLRFLTDEMTQIASAGSGQLGVAFVVALAVSLWSANAGVKALLGALNAAYEVREKRNYFKLTAISLAFTVGGILAAVAGLAVAVALPRILTPILPPLVRTLISWLLLIGGLLAGLAVLYRHAPCRGRVKWRWVTPGSLLATVTWLIASLVYSAYVSHFTHYEKTYGSIGAVIGFMTWLWISISVVLFGAELNTEIERRTKGLKPDAS
jgi:membrane protein